MVETPRLDRRQETAQPETSFVADRVLPTWRWLRREARALLREARSWPSLLVAVGTAVVALPLAILLTPGQEVATLGQHITVRSEEHTSELQSRRDLVCRLLLEKK